MNGDAYFDRMEQLKDIELGEKIGFKKGYEQAKKEFERPQGEWEKYGYETEAYDIQGNVSWGQKRKCTNCDFITTYIEDFGFYSFCPNCGADMRPRILDEADNGEGKDGNVKEGDKK